MSRPHALPRRHDAIALARARAEHAVIADEMETRRRDERGELLDQLLPREDDVRRAIAPAVFQALEQATMFVNAAKEFLEVIAGRAKPSCTIEDGVRVMRVIEAIRQSGARGQVVKP